MKKFYKVLLLAILFIASKDVAAQYALNVTAPDSLKATYPLVYGNAGIVPAAGLSGQIYSQAGLVCDTVVNALAKDRIVLIDRGTCGFNIKIEGARRAGAKACIICNNAAGIPPVIAATPQVNFPVLSLAQNDCAALRALLTRAGTTPMIANIGAGPCPAPTYSGDIFWGNQPGQGDFSTGLGGWTTKSITTGDTTVKFVRTPFDAPIFGGFNGSQSRIASPSACNGVATVSFVSLQTRDNPAYAQPYRIYTTELISPTLNCVGRNGVSVEFYQLNNRLNRNISYAISTDDGVTWTTPVVIPTSNVVNTAPLTELKTLLVPQFSNQARCKFKLIAEGDFYFFTVDDVVLTTKKINEIKVNKDWYAGAPNYATPYFQTQPFPLTLDIENIGNAPQTNTRVIATIRNNTTNAEVHRDTLKYGTVIAGFKDENRVFPKRVNLPQTQGVYTLTYEVTSDSAKAVADSRLSTTMEITKRVFSKTPTVAATIEGWRPGGATNFMSYGSHYKLPKGSWPNNAAITLEKVSTGVFVDSIAVGALQAGILTVDVFEWSKAAVDSFIRPADRKLIATGTQPIQGDIPTIDIPLADPLDANKKVVLTNTANKDIVVVTHITPLDPAKTSWFAGSVAPTDSRSRNFGLYNSVATAFAAGVSGLPPHNSFFASSANDDIETRVLQPSSLVYYNALHFVDVVQTSVELIDAGAKVDIYPNPASEYVNVDVSFDNDRTFVNIILTDMTGKIVSVDRFVNVTERSVQVNTSDLATGIYNLKVVTDKGFVSKNINVVR